MKKLFFPCFMLLFILGGCLEKSASPAPSNVPVEYLDVESYRESPDEFAIAKLVNDLVKAINEADIEQFRAVYRDDQHFEGDYKYWTENNIQIKKIEILEFGKKQQWKTGHSTVDAFIKITSSNQQNDVSREYQLFFENKENEWKLITFE